MTLHEYSLSTWLSNSKKLASQKSNNFSKIVSHPFTIGCCYNTVDYMLLLWVTGSDIRIRNQFIITRAFHFAQLALETFKLHSATQCDSDACLIVRLWLQNGEHE